MFCTWSAWQNPIVILTAPHSVRHVNGSAVCMWEGTGWGGGRGWIGAIVFEVGIWSSHLHLMPFRLLVLTRAKHLTQLGLIWWGHGMTPWPTLSVFSKWNQLSHRVGERWREVERISALMPGWTGNHWASRAHQSGAAWSLLGGHFIGVRPSLGRYAALQLSSQAEHLVKTHSVDLETITNEMVQML